MLRLDVFHTIFSTKDVTLLFFSQNLRRKFLMIRFLRPGTNEEKYIYYLKMLSEKTEEPFF